MTAQRVPKGSGAVVTRVHGSGPYMLTVKRAAMTEEALLNCVIDVARLHGWRVHHQRAARTANGYRSAIQGDAGFPDLVLARRGSANWHIAHVLFVELKSERGRVSPEQQAWLDALGPYACVWRPAQWFDGTVERTLR